MNIHSPAALIGTPLIYSCGIGTVHSMAQLQVNQLELMFTSNIRMEGKKCDLGACNRGMVVGDRSAGF